MRRTLAALAILAIFAAPAAAAELVPVTIGVVPVISVAGTYLALEKGWFRDAGLDVRLENINSASTAMSLLATNRMQIVEGGLSAGFFNALARGLPVTITLDRGSSPLHHDLGVRPDLKDRIKTIADLKGHSIGTPAPGSVGVYEVGKVIETAGLTLKDVELKYLAFPQLSVALKNNAVDVALFVPPYGQIAIAGGLAVNWIDSDDYIRPAPVEIAVFTANTDWTRAQPDVARRAFRVILRGAREYCQAYHHGPNRGEVMDLLIKFGAFTDRALLDRMPWQARDPNGKVNRASIEDVQHWFFQNGMVDAEVPMNRLLDESFAADAAASLGPFELVNKTSTLPGCR